MSRTSSGRREQWRQLIAEQEKSGKSVRVFCLERELGEYSFYTWRQRLRKEESVRFALVDTGRSGEMATIELILTSGDRLRIPGEAATLRMVLAVIRERLPASVRVYLCTAPCDMRRSDMRRSFDGLHALVTSVMQLNAFARHLFVFRIAGVTA